MDNLVWILWCVLGLTLIVAEVFTSDDAGEKALRQILRVRRRMSLPPEISVERSPVSLAKFLQRLALRRSRTIARAENDAPVSGGKRSGTVGGGG